MGGKKIKGHFHREKKRKKKGKKVATSNCRFSKRNNPIQGLKML